MYVAKGNPKSPLKKVSDWPLNFSNLLRFRSFVLVYFLFSECSKECIYNVLFYFYTIYISIYFCIYTYRNTYLIRSFG